MKLTILGTGSPLPIPNRAQTGFLLEKDGCLLLVDCGSGVYNRLQLLSIDWERLDTVLLTHHHLDHMSDLLTIFTARWLLGYPSATVYGPQGTRSLVRQWMALFPYVNDFVRVDVHDLDASQAVRIAGFEVETMEMRHFVTSMSYKFDQTLVICGDSDPLPALKEFSQGCRLLIHECSYTDDQASTGHANPTDLGKVLAGSDLEELWLTHFYPQAAAHGPDVVAAVKRHFGGKVCLAQDLQQVQLPALFNGGRPASQGG